MIFFILRYGTPKDPMKTSLQLPEIDMEKKKGLLFILKMSLVESNMDDKLE